MRDLLYSVPHILIIPLIILVILITMRLFTVMRLLRRSIDLDRKKKNTSPSFPDNPGIGWIHYDTATRQCWRYNRSRHWERVD
jgi:hypothetical protein